ncbi:MAG: GxxExxY protein, partial [Pontiellaceae bacterium]|jgi:GxxExxY protein|nr:GxxExxY protein [Pontiellaceae bacterium]
LQGVEVKRQVRLDLKYKDLVMDDEFTLDLIVEGKVIVELKVIKELAAIHEAQLMTYMKLTNCKVGLLINFNVLKLKDGIRRLSLP